MCFFSDGKEYTCRHRTGEVPENLTEIGKGRTTILQRRIKELEYYTKECVTLRTVNKETRSYVFSKSVCPIKSFTVESSSSDHSKEREREV